MNQLLKIENLSKSYLTGDNKIQVLDNISLCLDSGDMIAITGKSGSGKSTLLHLLGLLDTPDTGNIFFNNKEILPTDKNVEKFRNTHIGFVFQFHYLMADFTALENTALPAAIYNDISAFNHQLFSKCWKAISQKSWSTAKTTFKELIDTTINKNSWKYAKEKAEILLKQMDLSSRINHYPNQLSGGEQQRVAIARAMINNPDLIIADEPTGNLDKTHSDEIVNILLELNTQKKQALIVATHDLDIAKKMNRHYVLENGCLVSL